MSTRVLITGATGFIGRHLLEACRRCGHDVGALVVPDDHTALPGWVTVFRGTLEQPPWEAIERFSPEVCVHGAWVTTPGEYMTSPLNVLFEAWSRTFLTHLLAISVRRVIGVGSCIEYVAEGSEPSTAPYVQAKKRLRGFLAGETPAHSAGYVWGRVFFPYGEGEPKGKLCRSIVETLSRGDQFVLHCPDAVRDYIAVTDVARGLAMLVDSTVEGDIDLGSGVPVTIRDVAICIAEVMGVDSRTCFEWGNKPDGIILPVADIGRLDALGWKPTVTLRDGMERLVESLQEGEDDG